MTKRDCYLEALRLDSTHVKTWFNLGVDLAPGERVFVGGRGVGQRECFVEVLQLDPHDAEAWSRLARLLGRTESVLIGQRLMSERDCIERARSLLSAQAGARRPRG
jgi:hypothetical protein